MSTPEIRVNEPQLLEPAVTQSQKRPSEWVMILREAWRMGRTKVGVAIFGAIVFIAVAQASRPRLAHA